MLRLIGDISGCGCMVLYILNQARQKAWILPYVRTDIFNLVLANFAKHFEVGKNKQIVLAMDQAGWHTSRELEVPQGIHIIFMPSHSPELQPAERLWPVTNEAIANESFDSLDHLEEALFQRCSRHI
ncbi:MAG: transposase [Nostoc sp.]|uniref:transposase n=1 Tax=Nostoc sp. TaxID=1180 RepID=UPI002FFA402F